MRESDEATYDALRKRGLILVWAGEAWNDLEAAVSLWSSLAAGSVALLAFGLDSLIEIFAGFVLIWRLGREWKGDKEQAAEIKALRGCWGQFPSTRDLCALSGFGHTAWMAP